MNDRISNKLTKTDQEKITDMVLTSPIQAIKELRNLTGCSIADGKLWVNTLREKIWYEALPPCPFCNRKLRTPVAKQCRHCLRDWHDENNLTFLK